MSLNIVQETLENSKSDFLKYSLIIIKLGHTGFRDDIFMIYFNNYL